MKYYHNGKLLRTSTHVYTHALIDQNGRAITCSATREGCTKELNRRIRESEQRIANYENALKAQAAGKTQTIWHDGRSSFYMNLNNLMGLHKFAEYLETEKKVLDVKKHEWKIVELEAR